jgi:hypothetical protein
MAKAKLKPADTSIQSATLSNGRVSLFIEITPAVADHLDRIKTRKLTKADYVSALIEADMKRSKHK